MFSDHNGMELDINYKSKTGIHKCVETKQHATKQPMGERHRKRN